MEPSWDDLGASWALLRRLGASWGRLGAVLGPSWGHLGAVLGRLRPSWQHRLRKMPEYQNTWKNLRKINESCLLGAPSWPSWGAIGALLGRFGLSGASLRRPEAVWGHLRAVWGPSWSVLGPLGTLSGPSWGRLGPTWALLGPSGAPFGPLLGHLGATLEAIDQKRGRLQFASSPPRGPKHRLLGRPWGALGRSWGRFGALWGASWGPLGPS